ncbi:Pentatricopeptide repeat-containing protein [Hibiscus syriacus]|uniref:Pentatricopeptide repeat-containing protein n=1 Tax=Hibiscus syriacus TaxID=106335 RepID=A0A6A2WXG0_HIBSY|nr:Pentatricopeptide repeat-containing protein [Hibiscus syriacus]
MINILGNSGRILEMKQVIDQMKDDSCVCKDSVFVDAIRTFASAGMVNEALNLFNSIPQFNCVNFTESFNTILGIVLKESDFKAAYQLFSDNCWRLEVKSRVKSLNLLMEGLCQFKKSDLALNIFHEMDFQGCYPDRESYIILMKGLCDDGRLDEAIHLLYSMFWRISQKGSGEDIVIYHILLDAFCDDGKVEEALEILGKVLRKGLKAPKSRRQRLILSKCKDGEDSEDTKRLINEALIRGGVPSLGSYSAMAIDLYNEGRVDEGDKLFDEMRKRGFFPSLPMHEAKAAALSKKGRVSVVIKVIEEDINEGTCVSSVGLYNTILKCLCNAGDSELAVGYLKKMAKQVGCVANKETYSILVIGLCKDGKYNEASQVLEWMQIKSHRPGAETYNGLIKGLCLIGRQYEAVMWLEAMVSQGMVPALLIWNSLVASVCCKMSDREMFRLSSF